MTIDFTKPLEVLTADGWMPLEKHHIRNAIKEHSGFVNIYKHNIKGELTPIEERQINRSPGKRIFKTYEEAKNIALGDLSYVTTIEIKWKE